MRGTPSSPSPNVFTLCRVQTMDTHRNGQTPSPPKSHVLLPAIQPIPAVSALPQQHHLQQRREFLPAGTTSRHFDISLALLNPRKAWRPQTRNDPPSLPPTRARRWARFLLPRLPANLATVLFYPLDLPSISSSLLLNPAAPRCVWHSCSKNKMKSEPFIEVSDNDNDNTH